MSKLAHFISVITHPILLPTWMFLIIIVSGVCKVAHINAAICLSIVFATTFIIPAVFLLILKKIGVIKSLMMESREDRFIPIFILAIFLYVTTRFFSNIETLGIFNYYLICNTVLCAIVFWVNLYWKISMHTIGWGGFVAMLFVMSTVSARIYLPYFIASIIISGVVASARLYLKSHSDAQIYTGFTVGFIVVFTLYQFTVNC